MTCIEGSWNYVAMCDPGLVKQGTNITIIVKGNVNIYISGIPYVEPIEPVKSTTESEIDELDWRVGVPDNDNKFYGNHNNNLIDSVGLVPQTKNNSHSISNSINIYGPGNIQYGAQPSKTFKTNFNKNATNNYSVTSKTSNNIRTTLHSSNKSFIPSNSLYSYNNSDPRKGVIPSRTFKTGSDTTYKSIIDNDVQDAKKSNSKSTWRYSMPNISNNKFTGGAMPSRVFQSSNIENLGTQSSQNYDNKQIHGRTDRETVNSFKNFRDFEPNRGIFRTQNTSGTATNNFNNVNENKEQNFNDSNKPHLDNIENSKNQIENSYKHSRNKIYDADSKLNNIIADISKDSKKQFFGQSSDEKGSINGVFTSRIYFPDQKRPGNIKFDKMTADKAHNMEIKIKNGSIALKNKNDETLNINAEEINIQI